MIFHQFFENESSTYTYLIASEQTREAVLIDPVAQDDPLLDTNIDWSNWDAEMGMDLQNEIAQPINIDLDQLWGGYQQN